MKQYFKATRLYSTLVLSMALLLLSCGKDDEPETSVLYGPPTQIGQGTVRSWVKVTPDKKPVAIGISVSKKIVPSLPNEMTVYTLAFPEGIDMPPYNHVMLDWNPTGHPPMVYEMPHFDMHFYTISEADRKAVVPGPQGHTQQFQENYMPPSYVSGMEVVPDMGVHWVDGHSPEMHGESFTKTFVYGANNNKVIFYEPMITLAYLQSMDANRKEVIPVAQAPKVQQDGYHPQSYTIVNDTENDTYEVYISNLKYRTKE